MFGFCKRCNQFHCDQPEFDLSRGSRRDLLEEKVRKRLARPALSKSAQNAVRNGWPRDRDRPGSNVIDALVDLRESMGDTAFACWLKNLKNCGAVKRGEIIARMSATSLHDARDRIAAERAEDATNEDQLRKLMDAKADVEAVRRLRIEQICRRNGLPAPGADGLREAVLQRVSAGTLGVFDASRVLGITISRVKWLANHHHQHRVLNEEER